MSVVYLATPHASLHRRGDCLEVRENGEATADVRLHDLERVVIIGNAQVTTQALALLLDRGIDVSLLTGAGRPRGALVSGQSPNVFVRLAQYERWKDLTFRVGLARRVVAAKLTAQQRLLQRQARDHPDRVEAAAAEKFPELVERAGKAEQIDELMGLEGAGAAIYFGQFGRMLVGMAFPGRRKHPATDPVNALLSLGYVLLTNELASMAEARGLDPFVGFFHGLRYGRQSLPLDLVEPLRQPVVDRLVLRLVNLRQLGPDDFEGGEHGIRLEPAALKRYLGAYEEAMREPASGEGSPSWREVAGKQLDALKAMVLSGRPGEIFTWAG